MEYLDICDEAGQPTGEIVVRGAAHRDGILHRTAHVWVIRELNGQVQVLLQKRSRQKESFPGMYDASSAGHIPAGTEPLISALRELHEELGIQARPEELAFAGSFRCRYEAEFHGNLFRDNEFRLAYVYRESVEADKLELQESEVEEVRWFPLAEIEEELRHRRGRICVSEQGLGVLLDFLRSETRPTTKDGL